jgi:hypothetical protein
VSGKKSKPWSQNVETGLKIQDSERTSVRRIMSRLRGETNLKAEPPGEAGSIKETHSEKIVETSIRTYAG